MPLNKEAYLRYKIIDACISSKGRPYPSMEDIIDVCHEKLGHEFHTSTIQKDILAMKYDELLGYHAPIRYSRSNQGYYYEDKDYSIHSIPLNSSELDSLEAFADILSAFTGSRISENYNQAVQKIFASLKEKTVKQDRRKVIQTDSQINHKGFEHFEFFLHSIVEKIPVCFIHYSYSKRCFNSIIAHPVLLKEFQNRWYLVGYSEQHKCLRTFGLDRICSPLMMRTAFHDTPDEITDKYFSDIYGVYPLPGAKKQKIKFIASPLISEYIKANPIHTSQSIEKVKDSGHILFELTLIPSQELLNYFTQFSASINVVAPEFLYKNLCEAIRKANIFYS
jgi:predicted DNA-binding transcriptional regulator YafY